MNIDEAVVISKQEIMDEEKVLVAYIVAKKEIHHDELSEFLSRTLPPYMVP